MAETHTEQHTSLQDHTSIPNGVTVTDTPETATAPAPPPSTTAITSSTSSTSSESSTEWDKYGATPSVPSPTPHSERALNNGEASIHTPNASTAPAIPASPASSEASDEWEDCCPDSAPGPSSSTLNINPDGVTVILEEAPPPPVYSPFLIFLPDAGIRDVSPVDSLVENGLLGQLGRGGSGAAYRVKHKKTGLDVAAKFIGTKGVGWDNGTASITDEVRCQTIASGPGTGNHHTLIAPVVDHYVCEDHGCIMTPLAEDGTLADLIRRLYENTGMPAKMVLPLGMELITAILHMFDRGVIHRDLKLVNLLHHLKKEGDYGVQVIDFGSAAEISDKEEIKRGRGKGTTAFRSAERSDPERFAEPYSVSDALMGEMYSVGKIICCMIRGLDDPDPNWDPKSEWELIEKRIGNSDDANLVLSMLDDDMNKRPSLHELVQNGWPSAAPEKKMPQTLIGRKRKRQEDFGTPAKEERTTANAVPGPSTQKPSRASSGDAAPPPKKQKKEKAVQQPEPVRKMALRKRAPKK